MPVFTHPALTLRLQARIRREHNNEAKSAQTLTHASKFFALLVLAACGTNTSEQNPEAQKTAFSVYVLATGNSTSQATPWTLERGATTIKGQGKALEVESPTTG